MEFSLDWILGTIFLYLGDKTKFNKTGTRSINSSFPKTDTLKKSLRTPCLLTVRLIIPFFSKARNLSVNMV